MRSEVYDANCLVEQLSDTLISVLATRGGEIVNSIFGHFEVGEVASQKHSSSVIIEGIECT